MLNSSPAFDKYCQYAIRADVPGGLNYLFANQDEESQQLLSKLNNHFQNPPLPDGPKLLKDVLSVYFAYFAQIFTKNFSVEEAENFLVSTLSDRFGNSDKTSSKDIIFDIESRLKQDLQDLGYFFLGGRTLPYWGPYIYEKEEPVTYCVELPEASQNVSVVFMHNFFCMSWLDFATMGQMGTGGWAKENALYCVASKWDRKSEDFTVHYLKHEAQHQYDLQQFPWLFEDQETLEYRAKLAELVYSSQPSVLKRFLNEADSQSSSPHSRASDRIRIGFSKHAPISHEYSLPQIQTIAKQLLLASSQSLRQKSNDPTLDS